MQINKRSNTSHNEQLVSEILESRSQDLIRFLRSIVRKSLDAEDLFQSGSVRALENSDQLKDPDRVYPWILTIFRNLALDALRGHQRLINLTPLEPIQLENIPSDAQARTQETVCSCGTKLLKEIPKQYSDLLESIEINGRSVQQTARDLGTTPGNVSVRLHRARASLKHAVQEHCQVETLHECLDCACEE